MIKEIKYERSELGKVSDALFRSLNSKIVVFRGEMGSGKTTLIKSLIETMGSADVGHSPSFSLVNTYDTDSGAVYHFDLYRIEDPEEVWDFGFEDYLSSDNWLFIEWPELIIDFLPSDFNTIDIKIESELSRSLKLTINSEILT